MMIASVLHLTRSDVKALNITDAYSLHRIVYDLFDDIRNNEEKQKSVPSGILYADKGGDVHGRKILMLSNRAPNPPEHGELCIKKIADSFLDHPHYRFEVVVNPSKRAKLNRNETGKKVSGKIVALRKREDIATWFIEKAPQWGFSVTPEHLEIVNIAVKQFEKSGQTITQGQAQLIGRLTVTDKAKFVQSFQNGIGRGRAFGCGLLQIIPC
ncbi:MAG: type I-E CRISPR-associated protein Cas6/Cse3/CasE [Methylovulum sp.]|nr:type I-E CRISPR-associated protein Cas6/Cse3/CasE [Methylovulum sp.]